MIARDLAAIIERLPPDLAAELADALAARLATLKPSRAARLDERDAAIREIAAAFYADAPSRQEAARRIERDLTLFRPASTQNPSAGRAAALAGVLGLCSGRPPGRFQIENILAGRRR